MKNLVFLRGGGLVLTCTLCIFAPLGCADTTPDEASPPAPPRTARANMEHTTEVPIPVRADTRVTRRHPNRNTHTARKLGGRDAVTLLQLDKEAIQAAVAGWRVEGATLELEVVGRGRGAEGHALGLYIVRRPWAPERATYLCPSDANLRNHRQDCDVPWSFATPEDDEDGDEDGGEREHPRGRRGRDRHGRRGDRHHGHDDDRHGAPAVPAHDPIPVASVTLEGHRISRVRFDIADALPALLAQDAYGIAVRGTEDDVRLQFRSLEAATGAVHRCAWSS